MVCLKRDSRSRVAQDGGDEIVAVDRLRQVRHHACGLALLDGTLQHVRGLADHRQAECDMLCSPRLKQVIKDKSIELVGYETLREKFLGQMRQPPE